MSNPLIPGIHTPTGNLAMGFNSPTTAGTNGSLSPTASVLTRYSAYKLMTLTAGNEDWAQALAALENPPRIPQYILAFEVELATLSPFHNGWTFGITLCAQNIVFKPDAWWHYGMTTVTSSTVGTGSTSFSIADGSRIQSITTGTGLLDIFSSTGTYKGTISYGAFRVDSGVSTQSGSATIIDSSIASSDFGRPITGTGIPSKSYVGTVTPGTSFLISSTQGSQANANATATGTITMSLGYLSGATTVGTVPASGYGSIGYDPGTVNTLTTGTYTPGVQCPSGLVANDIVWSRATSNSTSNHGGGFFPEPRSATYATWATQSLAYYKSTVTGATSMSELWLDNLDTSDTRWPGSVDPIRPGGTTTSGIFTPTDWTTQQPAITTSEYLDSYAQCVKIYAAIAPNHKLWANTYPNNGSPWSGGSTTSTYLATINSYVDAGLTGVFLENGGGFAGQYGSSGGGWFTPAQVDACMSVYDALNNRGVEIVGVTQTQSATYAAALAEGRDNAAYAFHLIMWDEKNFYYAPASSSISGSYHQDWPRTSPYQQLIGRPLGINPSNRTRTGTNPVVYSRAFEYGTVSVAVSTTASAPTVTFTRTLS